MNAINPAVTVAIEYFAQLREQAGVDRETFETTTRTPGELYAELQAVRGFSLPASMLKVAVNATFVPWDRAFDHGDVIVFIPPVAGG